MKSFAIVAAAALFTAVSGRVLETRDTSTSSNIEVSLEHLPAFVPLTKPGAIAVEANGTKHKREEEHVTKRATLVVDIYLDSNYGGRHEGLITDTQKCYNLGNGWNDNISSLKVPGGFGCYFYQDIGCNSRWLMVTGPYDVSNTGDYGFNDNISSYLCYN